MRLPQEALTRLSARKLRHAPLMPTDKHGPDNRREFEVYWMCSNCNAELRGGMKDPASQWKFCPHCGARFERESDTYG